MPQGTVKKPKAGVAKNAKPTGPQRGNRVIKPKKQALVKQARMKHKTSSGLAAMTEATLAQRVGHLEMLKGGKRDKDGSGKKKAGEEAKKGSGKK